MKAIVQEGYGAPQRVLKLEEVDRPSVGDDDVLIRVRATSVNTPDWITVTGVPYVIRLKFGLRQPPTMVRGTDVAGVVESVGKNVTDLQHGDEVFGSSWADTLATPSTSRNTPWLRRPSSSRSPPDSPSRKPHHPSCRA